mmetsp:Transcript_15065/g.14635  ORF Transcript_15065/g.14635 Transcript_15065/m.14635 type:complete len:158 (+) Transcript_15065:176-649(+)
MAYSDICINDCIKEGKVYCPFNNQSAGYCLSEFDLAYQENICSTNATGDSSLQYWSCPNEEFCGNPYIDTFTNETIISYALGEYSNLVQGKSCKYLIRFPAFFSGTYDVVNVTLHSYSKLTVDAMVGTYYNSSVEHVTLQTEVPYTMTFPNQMFLLF